jgi:hypothetical protein
MSILIGRHSRRDAPHRWRPPPASFGQFKDGKPADEAVHHTCMGCHELGKARDFVFTRYAHGPM